MPDEGRDDGTDDEAREQPAESSGNDGAAPGDQIRLVLPSQPDYGRLARIAASSIALRQGMSFTEIEDLRIAVDETIILLLLPGDATGEITLEFTVEPDSIVIDASTTAGNGHVWPDAEAHTRFDAIVSETIDVHDVDAAARRVHLVKRF
jgi:hypothetical protein